jgi:hypothetical protein
MSKARDLADGTFDTDTLVVDAANNRVGVGTASPISILETYSTSSAGILSTTTTGYSGLRARSTSGNFYSFIDDSTGSAFGTGAYSRVFWSDGAYPIVFGTNSTERARIDSSGNLLVGAISGGSGKILSAGPADGSLFTFESDQSAYGSGNIGHIRFLNSNGGVGSINTNGSSTTYSTTSDYRLKENVVDLTGASDRVNQIPVHRFNFISDPDKTVDGFLAHEVQDIVPEAIIGTKDAMRDEEYEVTPAVLDDDGNVVTEAVMGTRSVPDYQGIDQSKLVPLLTAALQEALSEIADLKTRVAALETP